MSTESTFKFSSTNSVQIVSLILCISFNVVKFMLSIMLRKNKQSKCIFYKLFWIPTKNIILLGVDVKSLVITNAPHFLGGRIVTYFLILMEFFSIGK